MPLNTTFSAPLARAVAYFARGIGNAIEHQRVRAEHGPLGGVIFLHLVGRPEHLLGNALAAAQDDNGQHSCQRKGKAFVLFYIYVSSSSKTAGERADIFT